MHTSESTAWQRSLAKFVPPGAFDVHAHLYRREDALASLPAELEDAQGRVGRASYDANVRRWLGDRVPSGGLFFSIPKPTVDMPAANRFLLDEVRPHAGSRALLLIRPGDDPATVEAQVKAEHAAGFKVYHVYANRSDTFNAELGEFLPDWAWEIADRMNMVIMLHIVRTRAMADPANQAYLREHCLRYPGANLILAHAARSFSAQHTVEGVAVLRGLDNVYFDTSAVCEPEPMAAILETFGPSRLLFGTDFPVSEMRGRCVTVGDGFLWLDPANVAWDRSTFATPTFIGLESIRAVREACRMRRLRTADIEGVFGGYARQLLRIDRQPTGEQGQAAYRRARQVIPGGTQLLSKRPEMYAPERWPAYYREAHGCEVIDLDGRRFVDMTTSGIGSCLLGYADPDVTAAVQRRVELGSMCTLNCVEELELAELLIELHPWAQQVRYTRAGGEAMAVAVRIARAATGRDRIVLCGYHGWNDWYLAANLAERAPSGGGAADKADPLKNQLLPGLAPAGVPSGLTGTALTFNYNQLDELREQVKRHGREIAAVVMEPTRSTDPAPGFLEGIRELCDEIGAALVFDEVSAGWRLHLGGMHMRYGIVPDIAVFAKAISNGHPLGAVIGRAKTMEAAQTSFISSTYWTEGVGPTAALATIHKMQRIDLPAHAKRIGEQMSAGWRELGARHGVPVRVAGHPALLQIGFEHPEAAALGTLFTSRMLDRGFLVGGGFYPSLAHEDRHVDRFVTAAEPVFAELALAIRDGDIAKQLGTPVRHSGFARLT